MSCDLLPEWLNLFLDDVETTLCLPILLIMVLCTLQFIVNHAMDIGFTFYQNIMQKSDEEEEVKKDKGLMDKIRGSFSMWKNLFESILNILILFFYK